MKKYAAVLLSFFLLTFTLCFSSCESAAEKDLRVILQARCTADGNQSYTSELISGWDGSSGENIFWSVLEDRSHATLTLYASGRFEYATTLSLTHFIDSDMDAVNDDIENGQSWGTIKEVILNGTYSFSKLPNSLLLSIEDANLEIDGYTPSLDSLPIFGPADYLLKEGQFIFGFLRFSIVSLDEKAIRKAGGEVTPAETTPAESKSQETPRQPSEEKDKEPSKISAFFSKVWKSVKAHPWISGFIALLLLGALGGGTATKIPGKNPLRTLTLEDLDKLFEWLEERQEIIAKYNEAIDEKDSEIYLAEQANLVGDIENFNIHFRWAEDALERAKEYERNLDYIEEKIAKLTGISDMDKIIYYCKNLGKG